jgi:hypothetical protein
MEKEKLIAYIKANSEFYQFANMNGHTLVQLQQIQDRINIEQAEAKIIPGRSFSKE